MKEKDIWPNPYQPDTPTSLIAAAFRLLYFNVQEGVRECWQYAHRMTYATCEHPRRSVRLQSGYGWSRGIVCDQCGLVVDRPAAIHYMRQCLLPSDRSLREELEFFIDKELYHLIPAECWRVSNSDF